jgi:hypothetical protein
VIRTPPQHQTDPDKLPGQLVGDLSEALLGTMRLRLRPAGTRLGELPPVLGAGGTGYTIYKPAHGGYPGEVKAR